MYGLWQLCKNNTLILTVNERLARVLQQQKPATLEVTILPWRQWALQQWQQHAASILSPMQEVALWQSIIAADLKDASQQGLADLAAEAYRRCLEWRQPITEIPAVTTETRAFIRWAKQCEHSCIQHQFVTEAQAIAQVVEQRNDTLSYSTIVLAGFLHVTPQLQALMEHWQKAGATLHQWQLTTSFLAAPKVHACADPVSEYYHAALWAKAQSGSVAVVVPDLHRVGQTVIRVFDEVLGVSSYDLSSGQPLVQYPVIEAALKIVALKQSATAEQISQLLRCRYVAGAETERTERALLDVAMRQVLAQSCDLTEWLAQQQRLNQCPEWSMLLTAVDALLWPESATPQVWVQHIVDLLVAMGWPGEQPLNESEHSVVTQWHEILQRLGLLQPMPTEWSVAEMLSQLRRLLCATHVQSVTDSVAKIHVLGMLETAGLYFDAMWVCHLTSEQFPQSAKPNPLLPKAWQRQLDMPHASQTREVAFAKQLLQQWQQQTRQLYLSYAQQQEGMALMPSPLLMQYGIAEPLFAPLTRAQQLWQDQKPRVPLSIEAPPVDAAERMQLKGGAAIFKRQAVCPFQAFAMVRLHSEPLPEPVEYLDAKLRGMILHEVLQQVWQELAAQSVLQQRLQTGDTDWLRKLLQRVLKKWQTQWPRLLTPLMLQLEQQRLMKLLQQWLKLEAERPPFKVLAQEQTVYGHIAGIPLLLRLDRIDQLDSGETIIIDYKTGVVSRSKWYGDRPTEPQLPLYAILKPVQGVAFASLRSKQLGFEGVATRDELLPGVLAVSKDTSAPAAEWSTLTAYWQQTLTQLAERFLAGDATVDPLSTTEACDRCHLRSLCRIAERGSL